MRTRKLNRNKVRKQPLVTNDYSKEKEKEKKNQQKNNKKTTTKKARNAATAEPISAVSSLPPSSPL